jgi:transposase
MIDSTIVRAHQHATCIQNGVGEDLGRSRGGLTTKIHAVVDTNGLPFQVILFGGQQHDNLAACALLEGLPSGGMVLADEAHDATEIRTFVNSRGSWANTPPRRNRRDPYCFSPYLYRREIRSNAFSTGSSTVGVLRRAMRNTPPTSSPSSSLPPFGYCCAVMSPRPSPIATAVAAMQQMNLNTKRRLFTRQRQYKLLLWVC